MLLREFLSFIQEWAGKLPEDTYIYFANPDDCFPEFTKPTLKAFGSTGKQGDKRLQPQFIVTLDYSNDNVPLADGEDYSR